VQAQVKKPRPRESRPAPAGHVWVSRVRLPERRGQRCRLLVARRGKFLVEFPDGQLVATVRGTFRRRSE
jgi:hypothetical protein